jgi:hypothetical protein
LPAEDGEKIAGEEIAKGPGLEGDVGRGMGHGWENSKLETRNSKGLAHRVRFRGGGGAGGYLNMNLNPQGKFEIRKSKFENMGARSALYWAEKFMFKFTFKFKWGISDHRNAPRIHGEGI